MIGLIRCIVLWLVYSHSLLAQPVQPPIASPSVTNTLPSSAASGRLRPNYVLGPGDQIVLKAFEMEEVSERPFLIEGDGSINLPQLGRIPVSGLTLERLEALLVDRMRTLVQRPQVTVTVVQYRSEPVFFVGAFRAPGIYPLQGGRTLVEMLTTIGGLQPNASRRIKVTRRKDIGPLPLPGAVESVDGSVVSAEISIGSLRENVNPAEDISLQPFDVISVERAEMVYVNGEVAKTGGFELGERDSISVIQLISLAGGLSPNAMPTKARILRPVLNTSRRSEVPIDITRILTGKDNDFPLMPNDLLYVPKAGTWKKSALRTVLIALPTSSAILLLLRR